MQLLFRLFQRTKPEVPASEYGARLRRALDAAQGNLPEQRAFVEHLEHASPEELVSDSAALKRHLALMKENWDLVNGERECLEEVRPISELSRVHEEAVKYMRGMLEHLNHSNASVTRSLSLDFSGRDYHERESEAWAEVTVDVYQKLCHQLESVQRSNPTLFEQLSFKRSHIEALGLAESA